MKRLAMIAGAAMLSATLSGCGLHPLYAGGSGSAVGTEVMSAWTWLPMRSVNTAPAPL